MKELFTGFLSVSLSGSLIICMILLLRLVFRRVPKALFCVFWLLAILRLLMPFQIRASWSLQPQTPVITSQSERLRGPLLLASENKVTAVVPQASEDAPESGYVDYLAIAGILWSVGAAGMLLYTLISYLRLKHRVREAVMVEKGIYESPKLESAFLLGYFSPRIYLPGGLEQHAEELVIKHERAHIKRLDNWLKLVGFVCLSLHWFNPLVWISYVILCRDIEDACDERVIRDLDVQERKCYSNALLACGKQRTTLSACPVAFGEISIRQRILNVLNYRKPTVWICVVAVVAMVLISVFFMTDPMQKHPPYYEQLMDLLGEPVETVCQELELSQDTLTDITGTGDFYDTPLGAEFQGIPFKLRLCFDRGNGLLFSYQYVAKYDGDYNAIVQPAAELAKHLLKSHGKVYQWDLKDADKVELIASEEWVRSLFEERPDRIYGDQWDLTEYASESAKTYLDQIEISSYWQEIYAQRARMYGVSPHFYLTYKVYSNAEENASYIILEYNTGWQPGAYQSAISSDLFTAAYSEPRSWWDNMLNWLK